MAGYTPTEKEMDDLLKFINGEPGSDAVLDTDAPERLFAFTRSLQKAMLRHASDLRRRNENLAGRLDAIRQKKERRFEAGEFRCLEYDSLMLARAIVWSLKDKHQYVTRLKVNMILYHCYSNWLLRNGERLTIESPVAQEKGPWFWTVMTRLEIPAVPPKNWIDDVGAKNPGLREYLYNASAKYGQYGEDHLAAMYLQSFPYLNAHKNKNGGKWNRPISDADIYRYQKSIKQ